MPGLLDELVTCNDADKSDLFYTYLNRKARNAGIPLSGTFELTPRCNLDCKMCYVHLSENQIQKPVLTKEQWICLIDKACENGMLFATLTGGECLTYPGFCEIYEHLQSRGVLVTVLTNGVLLNSEMINWFTQRPPRRLQISVYGGTPETYEKVTGCANAFFSVDSALEGLRNSGLSYNIAITIAKNMMGDFDQLYRYCVRKNTDSIRINMLPLLPRPETGRVFESFAPTIDEQVEIYRRRMDIDGVKVQQHTEKADYVPKDLPQIGVSCSAGMTSFVITWDGRMIPCNGFEFVESYPLREDFAHAWGSIHKRACEYKLPVECFSCSAYFACTHCPAVHWQAVGEGHMNPFICEEGKRMAAEGIRNL